jgi:hypothetical protein
MADNESPTNIGKVLGYSVLTAGLLFTFMFACMLISIESMNTIAWFIAFLVLSFLLPLFSTLAAQYDRCGGNTNIGAATLGAFWTFIYIIIGYAIAQVEFVRSVVESCWYTDELKTVKALEAQYPRAKYFGIMYYICFAAMIGQVQGGGMAIKCS